MTPDERAFRMHVSGGAFQAGMDAGKWRVVSVDWPTAVLAVAAEERDGAPSEFYLLFELTGYPGIAPKGRPWDIDCADVLAIDKWPKGERVSTVFRHGWRTDALYIPCDREALIAHPEWKQQYPRTAWNETRDITHYLAKVHELLNDADYSGV